MRATLRALLRLLLRIFFRRIEVTGIDRVPAQGPVIFVLNHPNGLIDPAFMLCLAPRRVSFLAKAPLFRMPVIGSVCRAFQAIPVYRRQDPGTEMARNEETFDAARRVLLSGGAIALFPEGTSHSDPKLRPLKTGAARIALGAAAALPPPPPHSPHSPHSPQPQQAPLSVVPAGLYYRAKQTFRTAALLHFGEPFAVERLPLPPGSEPPVEAVLALTSRLERALHQLTLQAEQETALALVARAQRIFTAADEVPERPLTLEEEFEMRRRFLEGYRTLLQRWPARVAAVGRRMERYETALTAAGLDAKHLAPRSLTVRRIITYALESLLVIGVLLPAALVGLVVHYPAYRAVGLVATGIAKGEMDSLATIKLLAAMLLFPLTWGVAAALLAFVWAPPAAAVALLLPATGYAALVFAERLDRMRGATRALALFLLRRWAFLRLLAERHAIREEILRLSREVAAG